MKCPRCETAGEASRVFAPMVSMSTLMAHQAYWDEAGVYHSHDPNWDTSEYSCSNRHRWVVSRLYGCPAGDYGETKTRDLEPLPISTVYRQEGGELIGPFFTPAP